MAIEEEFSIEIPDKEADAIHSGEWDQAFHICIPDGGQTLTNLQVDQAVTYICAQPDAH